MQNQPYSVYVKYFFMALFFITLWGTDIPFTRNFGEGEAETGSSAVNQLMYVCLFLMSIIYLFPVKTELIKIIREEKFLFLYIMFSFVSMLWSDYSFLTFKRIFQVLVIYLSSVCFLLYVKDSEDIIKAFKVILFSYLILTILAVLTVPAARSGGQFMWRGFTSNKNTLGQIGFLSVILSYIIYRKESAGLKKTFALCMIFLAAIITVGSQSSTSFLIVFLLGGLGAITLLDSVFTSIRIGKTLSIISITTLFSLVLGVMIFNPDISTLLPELFGKDASFSGRTNLWEFLIDIGNDHPLLGTGYGAFWIPESERIASVYDVFTFLPGQAHNGYLDIFLASGYVGICLMLLMFINYILNLRNLSKPHPWMLFLIAVFIANFQESSLLRTGHQVNFFFMFAYLLAFVNKFKNFSWSPGKLEVENIPEPARNTVNRFKRVT